MSRQEVVVAYRVPPITLNVAVVVVQLDVTPQLGVLLDYEPCKIVHVLRRL